MKEMMKTIKRKDGVVAKKEKDVEEAMSQAMENSKQADFEYVVAYQTAEDEFLIAVNESEKLEEEVRAILELKRYEFQNAKNASFDAEECLGEVTASYEIARDLAKRARLLPKVEPDMSLIEDVDFSYLNQFIHNMREASEKVAKARNTISEMNQKKRV